MNTYWTISTLLGKEPFPGASCNTLCITHFTNAGVHALGHVLILATLGLRHKEQLHFQFSNLVWWSALGIDACRTLLALDTAHLFLNCPFVEASNINNVGTAKGLLLVVAQSHIRAAKATITRNQVSKPFVYRGIDVLRLLLLRLHLLLDVKLLAPAWGCKYTAEGRRFLT